jgi:hypothetical protein
MPFWYGQLGQRLKVDVRFLKFHALFLSATPPESRQSSRVVSIPQRVGAKKAKIWEWQECRIAGIATRRERGLTEDTIPWPHDPG